MISGISYILCIEQNRLLKNVYNNIMNLIKLQNRMDTIFMNSGNSKTSDPHRLLFNLSDKLKDKLKEKG